MGVEGVGELFIYDQRLMIAFCPRMPLLASMFAFRHTPLRWPAAIIALKQDTRGDFITLAHAVTELIKY